MKLQLYRGIYVAVKQFLPQTFINDVLNEAKRLMKLSHPNLPPYCIILQFEGIQNNGSQPQPQTLHQELQKDDILHGMDSGMFKLQYWYVSASQISVKFGKNS